jgi:hypothetical protein
VTGLVAAALVAATANAAQGEDYDRIEEDWEVVIGEPSPEEEAPQILNVISPFADHTREYFVFELNHSTQPDYAKGGMQLQRWTGETVHSWKTSANRSQLAIPAETVTYTVRMRLIDGDLWVSARNGQSQTWGEFGTGEMYVWSPTYMPNLNNYQTANSVANSRVGYASYRVTKFVLKEVRYYSNGELVLTDEEDRVVHEYNP